MVPAELRQSRHALAATTSERQVDATLADSTPKPKAMPSAGLTGPASRARKKSRSSDKMVLAAGRSLGGSPVRGDAERQTNMLLAATPESFMVVRRSRIFREIPVIEQARRDLDEAQPGPAVRVAALDIVAETALGLHHRCARPRGGGLPVRRGRGRRQRPAGHRSCRDRR